MLFDRRLPLDCCCCWQRRRCCSLIAAVGGVAGGGCWEIPKIPGMLRMMMMHWNRQQPSSTASFQSMSWQSMHHRWHCWLRPPSCHSLRCTVNGRHYRARWVPTGRCSLWCCSTRKRSLCGGGGGGGSVKILVWVCWFCFCILVFVLFDFLFVFLFEPVVNWCEFSTAAKEDDDWRESE